MISLFGGVPRPALFFILWLCRMYLSYSSLCCTYYFLFSLSPSRNLRGHASSSGYHVSQSLTALFWEEWLKNPAV